MQLNSTFSRDDFGGVQSANDFAFRPQGLDYTLEDGTILTAEGWQMTLPEYYDYVLDKMKTGGFGSRRELFQYSG